MSPPRDPALSALVESLQTPCPLAPCPGPGEAIPPTCRLCRSSATAARVDARLSGLLRRAPLPDPREDC